MGKPEEEVDDFDLYEEKGIKVYVRCDVQTKNDEITISYKKILFKGKLVVQGIDY